MDAEQLKQLTHLAALEIDKADLPEVWDGLARTLQMVQKLQQQDTEGVQSLRHPLELEQRTREDVASKDGAEVQQQVVENAPDSLGGLFLVPKVLD